MAYPVDLHIHSCLSPCAHPEMTPYNIVRMAELKGLDVIAVSDHNSARNLPAVVQAGQEHGVLVIPALEVQTREEVHVLAYFMDLAAAMDFGDWVYSLLPPIFNRLDIFGAQCIVGLHDTIIGEEPRLLLQSVEASIDCVVDQINQRDGFAVPAHINRNANSLLNLLGFIPHGIAFTAMEVCRLSVNQVFDIAQWDTLNSSDAHDLGAIAEPDFMLNIKDKSTLSVRNLFLSWKNKHI